MHIDFTKIQEALCESDVGRVLVDFTQIQSFFKKTAIDRVRVDFVKIQGVFCKIDIHKVWGLFCKNFIHGWWVDFTKVWGFSSSMLESRAAREARRSSTVFWSNVICDVLSIG